MFPEKTQCKHAVFLSLQGFVSQVSLDAYSANNFDLHFQRKQLAQYPHIINLLECMATLAIHA